MPSYGRSRAITGSNLSSIVALQGRRSLIKSIQSGTITMSGVTSATATITAVDTSQAELFHNGIMVGSSASDMRQDTKVVLTNTTTVTCTAGTVALPATSTMRYAVRERFSGAFRSLNRGTISTSGVTTNTATITAVDITKTIVRKLGATTVQITIDYQYITTLELTNATTITASVGANTSTEVTSYEASEDQ